MNQYILTLIDVRQVQTYLFNANELKQNLGASYLVEMACRGWVYESLPKPHNWPDYQKDEFTSGAIENGELQAEVVFSGGANAAILFLSMEQAAAFAKAYTQRVLERAPGLEVAVGHTPVEWDKPDGMKTAWERMQTEVMPARKEGRMVAQPLQGISVTAECAFTGKPPVIEIKDEAGVGTLFSSEAVAKHQHSAAADQRLNEALQIDPPLYRYPSDFDQLGGERGRARYIAVVHADGNGLGKRIKAYTAQADSNRETVARMRRISQEVNWAGQTALCTVRDWLLKSLTWDHAKSADRLEDRWQKENFIRLNQDFLPVRPIVYGGDDITLVCDGRLGLPLAAELIKAFAQQKLSDGEPIYACAGVAVVHSHYPFARAYALAENLCRDAKGAARQLDPEKRLGMLNWYYASAGRTLESWKEISALEYQTSEGSLALRPVMVTHASGTTFDAWSTWDALTSLVEQFRIGHWADRRNKVKELESALRLGSQAVKKFTTAHGKLPRLKFLDPKTEYESKGWLENKCVYFDALEANDLFVYPQYGGES
jgi:hypothetical protein